MKAGSAREGPPTGADGKIFAPDQGISAVSASNLGNGMVTDDEGNLIARSRSGDWDAFAVLIRNHQRMIRTLAYRMSGSAADADDLAQETFIRAYQSLDTYRGAAKFSSWLYRIALNLCLRWRKLERRRGVTEHDWAGAGVNDHAPDIRSERVQEALNLLPPKQRAAVIMTLVEGMTQAEAAAMLGCPEKTLSWRMSSAHRRLEKLMREGDSAP